MSDIRGVSVLSNTTWDQRKVFYDEVEALLLRGFLVSHIDVGSVRVAVRSLGASDFFLLRHRGDLFTSEKTWKSWVVAESVWMIGGQIVLGDFNMSAKIQPFFFALPPSILDAAYQEVTSLHILGEESVEGAESYCYEAHSRRLWKSFGGLFQGGASSSGIPGSERVALNPVQKLWIYFNTIEDEREQEIKEWNNAKLIVSAQNPKAGRSLNARERSIMRVERNRRQEVQDRFYYIKTGTLDEDGNLKGKAVILKASKTLEELQDEFYRWRTGDKDFHDEVVEEYKRNIRRGMERQKREMEELRVEVTRRLQAVEDARMERPKRTPLVGYTAEQMDDILRRKGRKNTKNVRVILEDKAYRQMLYDKFVRRDPRLYPEGGLRLDAHGEVVPIVPEEQPSLTQAIRGRRVTVDTLSDEEFEP